MLKDDDPGGGTFALFLLLHPGAFRQLLCPHPEEFAHLKKNANAWGLAPPLPPPPHGGTWALLELTDALTTP